jgi:hypothetical protein
VRSINPELCEGLLDFICLGRLGTNTGSVSLGFPYCSSRGEALLVRQKKERKADAPQDSTVNTRREAGAPPNWVCVTLNRDIP